MKAPAATLNTFGNGVTLRSVDVQFPDSGSSFPGRAGAELNADNCTACHSPGMILNRPSFSAAQWQAEVYHMRNDSKEPVAQDDLARIVAYPATTKGPK